MQPGATFELKYTVQKQDLASEVGVDAQDFFPEVLATSRMIGLMEVAAARLMRPLLQEGDLSVGVGVEIKHFAPTPVQEEISVVAEFVALEGKLYRFKLVVADRAGTVAKGEHTRAIVAATRLLDGARKRMAEAAN